MAKAGATDAGLERLKSETASGNIGSLYVFYGEEAYLRTAYFEKIKKLLVSPDFEDLNFTLIDGKDFTPDKLCTAVEAYPVMAERRMVAVSDYDIMRAPAAYSEQLCEILSDLPEYVCLIFIYDTVEFKSDKKNPVCSLIQKNGTVVNFKKAGSAELNRWIAKRFSALGKKIAPSECEYISFYCGNSMLLLISEAEKTAAFCSGDTIKKSDIEAVCIKNLDAAIYEMTDCISAKKPGAALLKMRELIGLGYEPIVLSASLCKQINRMYSAALCLKYGKGRDHLMKLWEMKSSYPAEKLFGACRSLKLGSLRKALLICGQSDFDMKSRGFDRQVMLELMLLRICSALAE